MAVLCNVFVSGTESDLGRGCVVNYSFGGIAIATTLQLPMGAEIRIRINLESEKLDLFGKAVYSKQIMGDAYTYGVQYTRMGFFDKFKLKRKFNGLLKSQQKNLP